MIPRSTLYWRGNVTIWNIWNIASILITLFHTHRNIPFDKGTSVSLQGPSFFVSRTTGLLDVLNNKWNSSLDLYNQVRCNTGLQWNLWHHMDIAPPTNQNGIDRRGLEQEVLCIEEEMWRYGTSQWKSSLETKKD